VKSHDDTEGHFIHCCLPEIDAELQNTHKTHLTALASPLAISHEATMSNHLALLPEADLPVAVHPKSTPNS
jgi:hypothetical protein